MLYRPVGQAELDLIKASGWSAFPPRLPEQPIFYPVLNEGTRSRSPGTGTRAMTGQVESATYFASR